MLVPPDARRLTAATAVRKHVSRKTTDLADLRTDHAPGKRMRSMTTERVEELRVAVVRAHLWLRGSQRLAWAREFRSLVAEP